MIQAMLRVLALLAAGTTGTAVEPHAPPQVGDVARPPGKVPAEQIVVVTASRREEQLRNAPATMSVIAREKITHGGGQTVTDLLRHVPGVNVSQTSARDVNVTPRAATGTLSDSLLVLLDGRSIYQDFFGAVLWDFVPIALNEIEQLEVIRGPASAVWGANAMNGVVNVISKRPREMQGTSLGIRFGQFDRTPPGEPFDGGGLFAVDVTHAAATSDRFAYKVSAGFLTQEAFLRPTGIISGSSVAYPVFPNTGTTQPRLDARVDYDLADRRRSLVLAGGITGTQGMIHSGLGPLDIHRGSTFKYGRIAYTDGRLKLRAFVNALDGDAGAALVKAESGDVFESSFEDQAYDLEVSNVHVFGARHVVSYGGNYRYNNFDLSIAPRGTHRNEAGAYVQDEIVLSNQYRWIVGMRLDGFDVLRKVVLSPRTTLLLRPRPEHTIRLSYNRAFRAPSFVNSYLDTSFLIEADLPIAGPFPVPVVAVGNDQLREEALTAYEAAYSVALGRVTAGAAVYVNRVSNAIQFTQTGSYTSSDPPPGWPLPPSVLDDLIDRGLGLPSSFSYLNFERITDRGLELTGEMRVTSALSVFGNYSWQDQPRAQGVDIGELNLPPPHRVNAGINAARGRYFGSLSGSFVDSAFWQDVLTQHRGLTASYTLVDGAFGLYSTDRLMTVTGRVTNLLNTRVQQHAFGDVIRRALTGEIRFRF
jgi:outer membrane receptor protein involved in Fe transport